ncbi:phosphorylated adapter RNA export protein [Patella vulgata]|uniref:phosphorylated adapter RNA export protein n=1 Tax=Patella vulgata TaxID=6465 RepID=UPI0024A8763A|nr:phosphorylated adapter RNA export protein [Patella vulgata]
MDDLEDGEVIDSDSNENVDEVKDSRLGPSGVLKSLQPDIVQCTTNLANKSLEDRHAQVNSYRSSSAYAAYSDESDASSDEDSELWNRKRAKYLSSDRAKEFSSKHNGPNYSKTEHFIHSPRKPTSGFLNNSNTTTSHKKKNNIWGAVIQEQTLTQGIIGFGVDKDGDLQCDRNVESYDYTKSHLDSRPSVEPDLVAVGPSHDDPFGEIVDLEPEEGSHGLKRKRPAKLRIGKRTFDKTKSREHIGATAEDSVPQIVNAIVKSLNEPKVDLMHRVVETLGKRKALELLYLTEDVEESGGMFVMNGERRRTPGGVFLQLLKMDMDVTKANIKQIFAEEEKIKVKIARESRRRKLQKIKQKQSEMEQDGDDVRTNGAEGLQTSSDDLDSPKKSDDCETMVDLAEEEEISLS